MRLLSFGYAFFLNLLYEERNVTGTNSAEVL